MKYLLLVSVLALSATLSAQQTKNPKIYVDVLPDRIFIFKDGEDTSAYPSQEEVAKDMGYKQGPSLLGASYKAYTKTMSQPMPPEIRKKTVVFDYDEAGNLKGCRASSESAPNPEYVDRSSFHRTVILSILVTGVCAYWFGKLIERANKKASHLTTYKTPVI